MPPYTEPLRVKAGTTTVGTSVAALPAFKASQVMLQAPSTNSATIKFGDGSVQSMELVAGATLVVPITDLSDVHVSAASNQPLHYFAAR